MSQHNDKIKLTVDDYTETPNGYELFCVHPNESEYVIRHVSVEQIAAHLMCDGQGNVPVMEFKPYREWQSDLHCHTEEWDEQEQFIPLDKHLSEMDLADKCVMLADIVNKREGRTESVKMPITASDFMPFKALQSILSQVGQRAA